MTSARGHRPPVSGHATWTARWRGCAQVRVSIRPLAALCRLHRSISAVRGCTCGPLMRRRFHAEKLRIPVHLSLVRHAGNVAPDHQEHIGSVSFVASFSYVLRRSAYTTQDRQPRSRTLLTFPGPSRADLESVLRNPREATTLRCNLRIALLTYASAQAAPGGGASF